MASAIQFCLNVLCALQQIVTVWTITAKIHCYWAVSSNKVARCNCEWAVRPSAFMSPTNANCRLQQMQTTLSCKSRGIQMDIPPVQL